MGRNKDPLPDECDFCGQSLDEDEELVPVWTGEPPEPLPESVQHVVDKPKRGTVGGSPLSASEPEVLGKRVSEVKALLGALEAHPWTEAETSPVVEEVEAVFAAPGEAAEPPSVERRRDKSAATVRVEPEYAHREPDLLVCELCEEAFS